MQDNDPSNDLDELIRESAAENLEAIEPLDSEVNDKPGTLVNHPWTLLFSWLLSISVFVSFYLAPLPKQHDLGTRSVETRISVAMYHVAHHVETYRKQTGELPDYLENDWQESQNIEYRIGPSGYELTGRSGEFERRYQEGTDPEQLLLTRSKRTGSK